MVNWCQDEVKFSIPDVICSTSSPPESLPMPLRGASFRSDLPAAVLFIHFIYVNLRDLLCTY
jgi:hypothetical protein